MKLWRMENMFKKTLLALAITGFAGTAFAAADLKTGSEANAIDFSIEGSASKVNILAGAVEVDLGAEYSVGDILTFTVVGGDIDLTTVPSNYTTNGVNAGSVTVGLLNSTASQLTYRVTEIVAGATTIGETVIIAGLEFTRASVVAGSSVVATYSAATSTGQAIDTSSTNASGTIISASNQFTIAAMPTLFDAVVDVEAQRLAFEGPSNTDLAAFTTVSDGALIYPATVVDFDLSLAGSFSFLDEDADTVGIQITPGQVLPTPTTVTDSAITWDAVAVGAHAITIKTDLATDVTPTQKFYYAATANFTDHGTAEAAGTATAVGTKAVATNSALGEWTLNGSVVEVPYMPFGPNTQPIIRHTNDGGQTGDISLRYMVEGVDTSYQDAGIIVAQAAPGVRNLLTEVNAAMVAAGYDAATTGFKVALELTTNVPADDVKVTAGAKVTTSDSDRLSIGVISSNQ